MPYANLPAFLVSAPLYRAQAFKDFSVRQHQSGTYQVSAPPLVDRECPTCGLTKWKFAMGAYAAEVSERTLDHLSYVCKNCEKHHFDVWIIWWRAGAGPTFVKAGQYPKLEVSIPKEFEKALGDKRSLYIKGMTSRHAGYGIGALTYFRRVIEDTTDEMLALLEDAMKATNADAAAIETLQKARGGKRFEEKVKIAAEVMPAHLRPGGINPFGDLYELVSIGLHDLTDEECCDIVDAMDRSLKFIYTQLKTHAEDAKAYEQAVKKIHGSVAELKQRDSK